MSEHRQRRKGLMVVRRKATGLWRKRVHMLSNRLRSQVPLPDVDVKREEAPVEPV